MNPDLDPAPGPCAPHLPQYWDSSTLKLNPGAVLQMEVRVDDKPFSGVADTGTVLCSKAPPVFVTSGSKGPTPTIACPSIAAADGGAVVGRYVAVRLLDVSAGAWGSQVYKAAMCGVDVWALVRSTAGVVAVVVVVVGLRSGLYVGGRGAVVISCCPPSRGPAAACGRGLAS